MGVFDFLYKKMTGPPGHAFPVGSRVVLVDAPFWTANREYIGRVAIVEAHLSPAEFLSRFPPGISFPDGLPPYPCYKLMVAGKPLYNWEPALRRIDDDEDKSGLSDEKPNDLTTWDRVPHFKPKVKV